MSRENIERELRRLRLKALLFGLGISFIAIVLIGGLLTKLTTISYHRLSAIMMGIIGSSYFWNPWWWKLNRIEGLPVMTYRKAFVATVATIAMTFAVVKGLTWLWLRLM